MAATWEQRRGLDETSEIRGEDLRATRAGSLEVDAGDTESYSVINFCCQ